MNIEIATYAEAEARAAALGKTFTPGSEEEFAAFEEKYLGAYDLIFAAIGQVASLDEAGVTKGGDLSMSDGMTPGRMIGVVIENRAAFRPELLRAVCGILSELDDEYEDAKFAVQLQKVPTTVWVFPGDSVLVEKDSDENDLKALGLR